jgi:hypothetical protein
MVLQRSFVSARLNLSRRFMLNSVPMSLILSFGVQHHAQGHSPEGRTVEMRALKHRQDMSARQQTTYRSG